MFRLILAEKPSVARDLARVLGVRHKKEGYLEGNGYRITWAIGHLLHFAEPDDYGGVWAQRWRLETLPMIPEQWQLKTDARTLTQLRLVIQLFNAQETKNIVCATDAGREGELIFRFIYEYAQCQKPVFRLWISSLTDEAIIDGFKQLKPNTAFDDLARAARVRAQADWLIGMNLTRAYTVHNRVLCTIGRVQTPTLALVVARDAAIAGFIKSYFYELHAQFAEGFNARYVYEGETRIANKAIAEALYRHLLPHPIATVQHITHKIRRHFPPPLYDLTNLQRDAHRRFGLTAAQVLEQAQTLYETHKLISYPRTESRHIGEDLIPRLPGLLKRVSHPLATEAYDRLLNGHTLGKAYVDQTKLTDHHAIIPTGTLPDPHLSETLLGIYNLIITRFVAIFLPAQLVKETRVILQIHDATFLAYESIEQDPGWKRVEPRTITPACALPPLIEGQILHVTELMIHEGETEPPRPYDDASLLIAMKQAGRDLDDETLANAIREAGLGTPATRAETVEKLLRTGYLERQRKQLISTAKGRALIHLVAEPLRSPRLTAEWEQRLKEVEQGTVLASDFYQGIVDLVRGLIPCVIAGPTFSHEQVLTTRSISNNKHSGQATDLGICPICHQGQIIEHSKAYGCDRYQAGCGFTVWKTIAGLTLTPAHVQQIINQGYTPRLSGFISKSGKPFSACLRLNTEGKVIFDFNNDASQVTLISEAQYHELRCPRCHQGKIIEGRRGYGCDRYRQGCQLVIWKEIAGVLLNDSDIRSLIIERRTRFIHGFTHENGQLFAAYLRLNEQWQVVFEFSADSPKITDES